jgi:hypothetical protein
MKYLLATAACLSGLAAPLAAHNTSAAIDGLQSVSCTATTCVTVGAITKGSASSALAEGLTGTKWEVQRPAALKSAADSYLYGVSCPSVKNCVGVGSYLRSSSLTRALVEVWNGTKWSTRSAADESGSPATSLMAVSCSSAISCMAVGNAMTPREVAFAFSETMSGSKLTAVSTPSPTNAQKSFLTSVSCPAANTCWAVGDYLSSTTGNAGPLSERWDGKKWTIVTAPAPAGAVGTVLNGVSCTSATSCVAVADYTKKSSSAGLLASEIWNGKTWTVGTIASPSGSTSAYLSSMSCTTSSTCTAVGEYSTKTAGSVLVEGFNGSKWTAQAAPNPAGSNSAWLYGVSCVSAKSCTAVGGDTRHTDTIYTLAEAWNGSKWTQETTPN